jgi:hypothetical protein
MSVLKGMSDVVARGALLTQIAQRFGVSEEELRRTAVAQETPRLQGQTPPERRDPQRTQVSAEDELIVLMLVRQRIALQVADAGIIPMFQKWGEMAVEIVNSWQQSGAVDLGVFLGRLPKAMADRMTREYARVDSEQEELGQEQLARDCMAKLRETQRKSERERLRRELREAEQQGDENELRLRLQRLQQWDRQE